MAFPHFTNIVIHNFSSEMNIHKVFHFTPMLCIMLKKLIGIWENAQIGHNSNTLNMIISYPPKIRQRVEKLPQYKGMIKQRKKLM